MKIDTLHPQSAALLLDDGSAVALDDLVASLVVALKTHGHYGNVVHHVSKGNWDAVAKALRSLLSGPLTTIPTASLSANIVRLLSGRGSANIRSLRPWLLERLEREGSVLLAALVERRLDMANDDLAKRHPVFRKSSLRILSTH